jgi:hypothetical protein
MSIITSIPDDYQLITIIEYRHSVYVISRSTTKLKRAL